LAERELGNTHRDLVPVVVVPLPARKLVEVLAGVDVRVDGGVHVFREARNHHAAGKLRRGLRKVLAPVVLLDEPGVLEALYKVPALLAAGYGVQELVVDARSIAG